MEIFRYEFQIKHLLCLFVNRIPDFPLQPVDLLIMLVWMIGIIIIRLYLNPLFFQFVINIKYQESRMFFL